MSAVRGSRGNHAVGLHLDDRGDVTVDALGKHGGYQNGLACSIAEKTNSVSTARSLVDDCLVLRNIRPL